MVYLNLYESEKLKVKNFKNKINIMSLFYISMIIPVIIIIINAIKTLFLMFNIYKLIIAIILLIICAFISVLLIRKKQFKNKTYLYPLILIVISIIIQSVNLILISGSITQISDFYIHFNNAVAETPNFANAFHFYHWVLLAKVFRVASFIFGGTQISAIVFISFITLINVMLVYYLALLIFKKELYAFISGLIYSLWPSVILYQNIFSTEHLAITFILLSIVLFLILEKGINKRAKANSLILAIMIGVILAILKFFKPVAIIIIIAIFIYNFIYKVFFTRIRTINYFKICCLLSILVFYNFTSILIFNYIDNVVGKRVNRNPTSFYIYMGLSPTNERLGLYSGDIVNKYMNYVDEFNGNFNLVEKALYTDLKKEYKDNYNAFFAIIKNKFKNTWYDDTTILWWVNASINTPEQLLIERELFLKIAKCCSQLYYIVVMILFLVGISSCAFNSQKSNYFFLINLFIVGVSLLLLIGETQGRYKVITYPFIAIVVTKGILYIEEQRQKLS